MSNPRITQLPKPILSALLTLDAGSAAWCRDNPHIVLRFFDEADKVWLRGRKHYSARTIVEVLRHESALREIADTPSWKINNNAIPGLARLYVTVNPGRASLFELRGGA